MADFKEKSFDFANDTVKLLLTLNTGVLAFTLTFLKDVVGSNPIEKRLLLIISWFIFLLSVFCCLWALLAIAGSLKKLGENNSTSNTNIYDTNISVPTGLAIITFLVGMLLMIIFTLANFKPSKNKPIETNKKDTVVVKIYPQAPPVTLPPKPSCKRK